MSIAIDPIVAVDAMVLVCGLRDDGPAEKCKKAQWLFRQFTARKTQVILPSVALAEYLTNVQAADQPNVIAELKERFLIMPFDETCAVWATELFRHGLKMRTKGVEGGRA